MKVYYDRGNKRLVYIGERATPDFWDSHWKTEDFERYIKRRKNSFIVKNTRKYLPKGAKILEGGCGRGDKVYALRANGYQAYGIDNAKETVDTINRCVPELNISLGDVRKVEFEDGHFDGYWSLGVIEHFYEGYDQILREMHRVLRSGGYLFVTVPTMSWLRRFKARLGMYPEYRDTNEMKQRFYQFALDPKEVIERFGAHGFDLGEKKGYNGVKGLKDEIVWLRPLFQRVYDSPLLLVRVVKKAVDMVTKHFANHSILLVFRKM